MKPINRFRCFLLMMTALLLTHLAGSVARKLITPIRFSSATGMASPGWLTSTGRVVLDATDNQERLHALEAKQSEAATARANELKVEHKQAVTIDPALLDKYVGKYEIAPGEFFLVEKKEGKLYFSDRGNSAELFPESPAKFFIRYPADLTVTFETDANGTVTGLIFSMNGREMRAKRR